MAQFKPGWGKPPAPKPNTKTRPEYADGTAAVRRHKALTAAADAERAALKAAGGIVDGKRGRKPNVSARKHKPPALYVSPLVGLPAKWKRRTVWYARDLLHMAHWGRVGGRWLEDGFARLNARMLDKVVPGPIRRGLVRHLSDPRRPGGPVIEVDEYVGAGRSRGYRLLPPYDETRRLVCTDPGVNQQVWKLMAGQPKLHEVHRWLERKLPALELDWGRAVEVIETLEPDEFGPATPEEAADADARARRRHARAVRRADARGKPHPRPPRPVRAVPRAEQVAEYRRHLRERAKMLADGEHYFTRCDFGRVHTPVTSLPKALRPCLSVGGKPLVGLDLKNSQPLFLALLAVRWYQGKARERDRVRAALIDAEFGPGVDPHAGRPPRVDARDLEGVPEDVVRLLRVCEAGGFYESFEVKDRDAAKKAMMLVMFAKNCVRSIEKNKFETTYPCVAAMLRELKRKRYERAAWLLQRDESRFFIQRVCGRIMAERPAAPVFTIHDSVYTTAEYVGYVEQVVRAKFAAMGVVPNLKPEGLT